MRRVLVPLDIAAPPRPPAAAQLCSLGGTTMGTTWSVKIAMADRGALADIRRDIEHVLDGVIAEMSPWVSHSHISTFNRAAAGTWHDLPAGFATVLDCALAVARASDGAYDPTAGALVDLWGFGPPGPRHDPPSAQEIASAMATSGWQRLRRDGIGRVQQPGGLTLDLSSIAKGYAVDRVTERLTRNGFADVLVEIGGELRGHGVKPDGAPWWVELEQPPSMAPADHPPQTIVALHDLSVASSGDHRRFFRHDGRHYSHVIDPRSGYPVGNGTVSVTVLHRSCMTADAWATALMVMAPREAIACATTHSLAARVLMRHNGAWDELTTPAFAAMLD